MGCVLCVQWLTKLIVNAEADEAETRARARAVKDFMLTRKMLKVRRRVCRKNEGVIEENANEKRKTRSRAKGEGKGSRLAAGSEHEGKRWGSSAAASALGFI
jgi:hypothetical protein